FVNSGSALGPPRRIFPYLLKAMYKAKIRITLTVVTKNHPKLLEVQNRASSRRSSICSGKSIPTRINAMISIREVKNTTRLAVKDLLLTIFLDMKTYHF